MSETENKRENLSGEKARKWRRGVGALAEKSGKGSRARKFPLEIAENAFDFAEALRLFNAVEGVGRGSLLGLLCATHLSGFRVFGGASGAKKFRPRMTSGPSIAQDDARPFISLSPDEDDIAPHKVAALLARQIRGEKKAGAAVSAGDLKLPLLGGAESKPYGLSWLFGAGLAKMLANAEVGDKEIAEQMDADLHRVRQLREFARAVPLPPPFRKQENYRPFRVQVARKIGGWIGNYWKRLDELRAKVEDPPSLKLPPELDDPLVGEVARLAGAHPEDIRAAAESLPPLFEGAREALDTLAGYGDKIPGRAEVDKFDELKAAVDDYAARLRSVKNLAEQRVRIGEDGAFWKSLNAGLDKALSAAGKLEKLNRISGGAPNAASETIQTAAAFNALWRHRREQFAKVAPDAKGICAALEADEADEKKALQQRGKNPEDAPEFAVRKLLHRIGNAARKMRPENREEIAAKIRPLFANPREANGYFNSNIGAIYQSPHSRSIYPPFALNWREAREIDWTAELDSAAARMETRLCQQRPDDFRDWMETVGLAMTLRLRALPDETPREKVSALANIPAEAEAALRFSPALARALKANPVPRRAIVSAFNQLDSALRGLGFRVTRPDFIVRAAFHPALQDELIYAPKDALWNPPSGHRLRYAKSFDEMNPAKNEDGKLNAQDAVAALLKARQPKAGANALLTEDDRAALAVVPHDWLFPVAQWDIAAPERPGFTVFKEPAKDKKGFNLQPRAGLRLIGPASLKSALDDCLRGRIALGESALLTERRFAQTLEWKNGALALRISATDLRAELAVPVMSQKPVRKGDAFYEHLVSVDLGERGIGYAVFSVRRWLENGNDSPLESGVIPIPSIRALIRAVRRHRGIAQPGQKLRDSHSRALEKRRENVIGDVCGKIDSLCAKWRAFPVLEGDIQNLESGGSQLKLVYGSVVRRYIFSATPAHKKQRGEHWFTGDGGGIWRHPFLIRVKRDESGREKREPLKLFPGTQIDARRTSQQCSRCRRNALQRLREESKKNLTLRFRNGEADLAGDARLFPDGSPPAKLFLMEKPARPEPRQARKLRRLKQRPQLSAPLEGTRKAAELSALVKFNLRRPPESLRSRDTSQSRYFCVFADCRAQMHADENAAINIGRKLLSAIDREKSRKKSAEM